MTSSTQDPLRCFIAIELPEAVQERLLEIQDALKGHIPRASWVKRGNIHLTLKFLGDTSPEATEAIGAVLTSVAARHAAFSLTFGGVGAFPSLARPKTVWVGVKTGEPNAARLAQELDDVLKLLGFPPEKRRFNAHVTLAHLRAPADLSDFKKEKFETIDGSTLEVSAIALIQSELHPKGAIYTTLSTYPLAS